MEVIKGIQRLWHAFKQWVVMHKRGARRGQTTLSAVDPTTDLLPTVNPGQRIGLYLGSELTPDMIRYAIAICVRLSPRLTVLTFQSWSDAQALLNPYQTELEEAHIALQLTALYGEPPGALIQALRKRSDIAFLLCNESGYLARSLKKGIISQEGFPVSVVMVGTLPARAKPAQIASSPFAGRAAKI